MTYKSLIKRKINITFKNSIKYTIHKIKKFYPVHILLLVFVLFINFKNANNIKLIILSIPNILLLQSFIPIKSIYFGFNAVTWYLSSLVLCYLLSNVYAYFINKLNKKYIYIVLIWMIQLSLVYLGRNLENTHYIFYINPLWRSLDFLMGMILCDIVLDSKEIKILNYIKYNYIEVMLITIFLIMYFISRYIPDVYKYGVYYTPIFILIIYVFYYQKGILSKILGCKSMISLGNISFEFYMIHQVVIRIVNKFLGSKPILSVIVALLTTIIISIVLSKLLKKNYDYKMKKYVYFIYRDNDKEIILK